MKSGRSIAFVGVALALLLVAPSVTAQDAAVVGASVTLDIPFDMEDMEAYLPNNALPDRTTADCGGGQFAVASTFRGFRFSEGTDENGCGEARFAVDIPEGATGMALVYRAERILTQPVTDAAVNVEIHITQDVRIYDAANPSVALDSHSEFPPDASDASTGPDLLEDPYILPDARRIIVGWYFEEQGPSINEQVPSTLFGQSLTATVAEPSIRFYGVPADDVSVERIRGGAGQDSVDVERRVRAALPEDLPPQAVASLRFQVVDSLSINDVTAPDGTTLPLSVLELDDTGGVLSVTLSDKVLDQYGRGVYTASFAGTEPLRGTPIMALAVITFMMFPVPTGVYATRGANQFRRMAVGGYITQANILRWSLYVWWIVYAALLLLVFGGGLWLLVTSWPLELQGAFIHAGFVVVATAFLFTGLYWRRRLMGIMEADLEEKKETNQELQRSNAELEQFAYVASHDLQEPLRTISRFTELVQHRYGKDLPEDANEFMDYTVDGARRMQALVDDLLTFSRVGTKGREFEDVPLADVVDQVVAGLAVAIDDNKATITKDNLPVVLGDRAQLAQVLQNLIANALKFRKKNRRPTIHIGAEKGEDGRWTISVSDNGIGIEPDQHDRIFVIFQRLHARDEYEGTGIGLAVVKKIIERHGGSIWLESEPKKGTTFFFSLTPGISEASAK